MYHPISPYQTRIICLHGACGKPDSPLICDLSPADILHPTFEGLGLRSPAADENRLVEFDALSYTWGGSDDAQVITCNGVRLPITKNLSEALLALRHTETSIQYIWVDAICINQSDDQEKSQQVRNMLMIYQKAAKVIAWLGPAHKDLSNLSDASALLVTEPCRESAFDVQSVMTGLSYLYTRPWFQRIWIQQEIFAARRLVFRCGALSFEWSPLLSNPNSLLRLPHLQAYVDSKKKKTKIVERVGAKFPDDVVSQVEALSSLDQLREQNLNCFEKFAAKKDVRPDFIETLLDTSILGATDPRDYVYGVLGITGFPAKPMSIQTWMTARQHEVFVPIDYSAAMTSILCAVTWALLMKGGLTVIAKFKAFRMNDNTTHEKSLPSWAIDWRLAGDLFHISKTAIESSNALANLRKIDNAWDRSVFYTTGGNLSLSYQQPQRLISWHPPPEHVAFCEENRTNLYHHTQILLRGTIDLRFYAKGRSVWEKRKVLKDRAIWHVGVDVFPTDVVVYMHNFRGVAFRLVSDETCAANNGEETSHSHGGPWLLRPVDGQYQFRLIACLSYISHDLRPFYRHWQWNPEQSQGWSTRQEQEPQYRRFAADPVHDMVDIKAAEELGTFESRYFIIV
jgi:hypothetical protein